MYRGRDEWIVKWLKMHSDTEFLLLHDELNLLERTIDDQYWTKLQMVEAFVNGTEVLSALFEQPVIYDVTLRIRRNDKDLAKRINGMVAEMKGWTSNDCVGNELGDIECLRFVNVERKKQQQEECEEE